VGWVSTGYQLALTLTITVGAWAVGPVGGREKGVARGSRGWWRLIADGLRSCRTRARVTLPSSSSTSKVTSKFRSGRAMRTPSHRTAGTWRSVHRQLSICAPSAR
ncbi:hypothetical protein, partial [Nocardia abscessus]|uniref:hypothetical protein n=1 Tax=Nocardia abscessus TaxID=120957 RepID=UPI0024542752